MLAGMVKEFIFASLKIAGMLGGWTALALAAGADPALIVVMAPFTALMIWGVWVREFG